MQKPPKSEAFVVQAGRLDTQKLTKNGYENQGLKHAPDIQTAQIFLDSLAEESLVTFQTFDDNSLRKNSTLSRILHGDLEQHHDELTQLNQAGAGIFFMVNEGDLKGRRKENITRVRAVFVDLDGAPLQPALNAPLQPHIVIESSPNRYHAYWKVDDIKLDEFSAIQKSLAAQFNSDQSVCDLPRVMRLPGFYHMKSVPFLTRVLRSEEFGL